MPPGLINILGHIAGAVLFGTFLALLFSRRGWSGAQGRRLSGVAAALSLCWNVGSLIVLVWQDMPGDSQGWLVALTFSILSVLPAVLLNISLRDRLPAVSVCGYALSGVAVAMHFWEVREHSPTLHQTALQIITVGFLVLTAATFARKPEGRSGAARISAAMCMALFAMSFVHFGPGHGHEAWSSELFLHHAGIPVALFLLLQDYRFVLLDAFIRFAANGILAAILSWAAVQAVRWAFGVPAAQDPLPQAALLVGLSLLLVLFAAMRGAVQRWIAHALFRQGGVARLPQTVKAAPPFADEASYLEWAARAMASAVRAGKYAILPHEAERPEWTEAAIPVRLGPGQAKWIALGPRPGGQRYLGEDIESLTRAAAEVEERAEALRRQEMDRLMNQAELRALQSQINPHFLFNALNALYGSIPREASGARRLVLHLADIFRYFLQSDKGFVTVDEEMQIVRAYLDVEKFRLGDRLHLEIEIDPAALDARIPALSVQPLVENAIRHGIARRTEPGFLRITAQCRGDELRIAIVNSGAGPSGDTGFGMGLQNVRRRLEICYGAAAELELRFEEAEARAEVRLPVKEAVRAI
jgi:two-component system, LytTR family, sensor kinase